MQPYQHITARGNRGVITLASSRPHEKLVTLGASCMASADSSTGPVLSFSVVPKRSIEVVAVAVVDDSSAASAVEVFLLGVTLKSGKAEVDLQVPYGGTAEAVGQMVVENGFCRLKVFQGGKVRSSMPWKATGDIEICANEEGFDTLCKVLVEVSEEEVKPSSCN